MHRNTLRWPDAIATEWYSEKRATIKFSNVNCTELNSAAAPPSDVENNQMPIALNSTLSNHNFHLCHFSLLRISFRWGSKWGNDPNANCTEISYSCSSSSSKSCVTTNFSCVIPAVVWAVVTVLHQLIAKHQTSQCAHNLVERPLVM